MFQIKGPALFLAQCVQGQCNGLEITELAAHQFGELVAVPSAATHRPRLPARRQLRRQSRRKFQPGQHLGRHVGNKKGAIFP
jgi:hypothetical protein